MTDGQLTCTALQSEAKPCVRSQGDVSCTPSEALPCAGPAAGRTGRAGCTGISVVLVDRRKEGLIGLIERRAGMKFERIGAPQPQDMARVAGERAASAVTVRRLINPKHPKGLLLFSTNGVVEWLKCCCASLVWLPLA